MTRVVWIKQVLLEKQWPAICHRDRVDQLLQKIIAFAENAHQGQYRKYIPEPYIHHPLRVMETCALHSNDQCLQYAAVLHDVLEDTSVDQDELEHFLGNVLPPADASRTLSLVIELTDVYTKKAYPNWNRFKRRRKEAQRLRRTSADAQTIKYADILDNCAAIMDEDHHFGPRYLRECQLSLSLMQKGDTALYQEAKEVVLEGISKIATMMFIH